MRACESCGKEIPDETVGCAFCKEVQKGLLSEVSSKNPVLKKFRGYATKGGKKYAGVFEAVDEQDARQRLLDQGFEFVNIKPDLPPEIKRIHPLKLLFQRIWDKCCSQPILIMIPLVLIFLGVSLYQNTMETIRNRALAEEQSRPKGFQPGDKVILKQGYFMTGRTDLFNTALTHQRSGNAIALQKLFQNRAMVITREGMKVIYAGWDGLVPRAALVRFENSQDILYVDHEALYRDGEAREMRNEPGESPEKIGGAAGGSKKGP